jgi:hypothetical protein
MAALLQFLYASFTFYRTIGGQVNRYGFAAPGFTVLPYAVMSALNLMANLVAPHYPTLYLVRSEVMEEAEWRTGLPFDYVVGKVAESGTNNIVPEGWSEIAGSFKDDDKLLYVSPSAAREEDEKIEMCDSSRQTIYIPACPRFRRTDDTQTSPLRQFIESDLRRLEFPQYQYTARRQQISIQPSLFSFLRPSFQLDLQNYIEAIQSRLRSYLGALRSCLLHSTSHLPWVFQPFASFSVRLATRPDNVYEQFLIGVIISAELFITLALSNFSGRQSTLAQRAWTVTWLIVGHTSGIMIHPVVTTIFEIWELDTSPMQPRFGVCCYMVIYGAPAIGGFVVVSQMLKAYGICYKFV